MKSQVDQGTPSRFPLRFPFLPISLTPLTPPALSMSPRLAELGWRTPLEVAHTPTLDAIAAVGRTGLQDTAAPGLACGSDTAHLNLLGYPPRTYYRGRGAFESLGAGIAMQPGDIAFKCNFATYNPDTRVVIHRRVDRDFTVPGPVLCEYLDNLSIPGYPEHVVTVRYATEHRCGISLSGPRLSANITGTDPLRDGLQLGTCEAIVASPEGSDHPGERGDNNNDNDNDIQNDGDNGLILDKHDPHENHDDHDDAHYTARLVNALCLRIRELLASHPINQSRAREGKNIANVVLLRGCGVRLDAPSFADRHGGISAAILAPTKCILGIGLSCDMVPVLVDGATGDMETKLDRKAAAAVAVLTGKDIDDPGEGKGEEERGMRAGFRGSCGAGLARGRCDDHGATKGTEVRQEVSTVRTTILVKEEEEEEEGEERTDGGGGHHRHPLPPTSPLRPSPNSSLPMSSSSLLSRSIDLLFLHVKAVDDAGHDRHAGLRVRWLERVDRMVRQCLRGLHAHAPHKYVVVINGDHSTPVVLGDHSHEPVPFAVAEVAKVAPRLGMDVREDLERLELLETIEPAEKGPWRQEEERWEEKRDSVGVDAGLFTERGCAGGELGRFLGADVMQIIRHYVQEVSGGEEGVGSG